MALRYIRASVELQNNLFIKESKRKELQLKKLKPLLTHAYENVPFYHQKFKQAGIKPVDVRTFKDLGRIPVTTKQELQEAASGSTVARNADLSACEKTRTTGSTGTPLSLLLDRRARIYDSVLWDRTFFRNGFRPWQRIVIIRDPAYFPRKRSFRHVRSLYVSALESAEQHIRIIRRFRPDAIKGYSTSLTEIARVLNERSEFIEPKLVFTGAAILRDSSRSLIRSSFGTEPFDNYGTMEFSLIAWECKAHSGYHINADSVLLELLDEDEQEEVAPGERGCVVCTGFNNYAMPLIRYRLADVATPISEECSCGVTLPLLKSIEGRENDFLIAMDGRRIPPATFYPYPFDNYVGIRQFKIIQDRRNRLIIKLAIAERAFDASCLGEARSRIQNVFGEGMQVEFEIVENFDKDTTGKPRLISRLF